MVQPFLPNTADAFDDIQASPESEDFEYLLLGHQRTGVLSGCAITEDPITPDMTVDVALGIVELDGSQITVAVQLGNVIATADGSNPRKDLISVNSSGSVVVTTGTPAAVPAAPAVPATSIPLAIVLVPTSDTAIEDAQITDKRILVGPNPATDQGVRFVAENGDDNNDGLTIETAFASPQAAVDNLVAYADANLGFINGRVHAGKVLIGPHTSFYDVGTGLQLKKG